MAGKISDKLHKATAGNVFGISVLAKLVRRKYRKADPDVFKFIDAAYSGLRLAYVYRNLKKKYRKQIIQFKQRIIEEDASLPHDHEKIIWIMWQQGMDNAPELVRMCYRSILNGFSDKFKIICLDENNVHDYITLPDHIIQKFKKGYITRQWFADLVRITLLDKYGGTWIDATMFYSGAEVPEFIFDDDLFYFQFPRVLGKLARLNSYFITACKNNKIIKLTKELFYEYWKKNNYNCDYWLIDDFFEMAVNEFPEEFDKIIPMACVDAHILEDNLAKPFDERIFSATISRMPFHKLTWKLDEEDMEREGTLYKYLLSHYPIYVPEKTE